MLQWLIINVRNSNSVNEADMFKCLIFIQGLIVNKDTEIQAQILTSLEQDTNLTLQKVAEDCNRKKSLA